MSANVRKMLAQIIADKTQLITQLTAELESLEQAHSCLDDAPKKAGKKAAKKAPAAATKKKVGKKAAKKAAAAPSAKKVGKKAAKKTVAPAAEARHTVTRGGPLMIDKVVSAMGSKNMNAGQVVEAMGSKGTMPESSNPKGYIACVLHTGEEKGVFKKVSRGVYCVDPSYKPQDGKKAGKKAPPNGDGKLPSETVESEVNDLNLGGESGVAENPFSE